MIVHSATHSTGDSLGIEELQLAIIFCPLSFDIVVKKPLSFDN